MALRDEIDARIKERESWALRRQLGIPNNRRLWVLTCMDERIPVNEALGIQDGDAHIFRNAGGLATDDAIRSAMLTTQFFGTTEIVVLGHTECGMMSAKADDLVDALRKKGIDTDAPGVDPTLPELHLEKGAFGKWIRLFEDVDASVLAQVEALRKSPLIPKDVTISGYVYEVESGTLRKPYEIVSQRVNTYEALHAKSS
ncbi:MAG TPA: carbonic anhydrase [Candidatus Hydrogenedentes bacterium]|nr:carbonic anhydrase [Candidatus Hydrogenedentota bacterium]HOL77779.1 carbonic anhydrase [Candidatus Hydrogenedentota bacterium]HPO86407.1 carbonic anhydrase [Candidatus Hydrogenedentota bacterium]